MREPISIKKRIKNALRIDRAFKLVWKASRTWTLLSICITVVQGALPLLTLYVMKLIIDAITAAIQTGSGGEQFVEVAYLIGAAALIAITQAALGQASSYVSEAQSLIVTDYVFAQIHKKSIDLDLSYYENPEYYDTLHRAQQEGPYRPTRIVSGLTSLIQNGVSFGAMVGLLFMFHWGVGILLLVSTLPGMLVQVLYARKRFEWQKKRTKDERRATYFNTVLTFPTYAKEIRLFDLGGHFSAMFNAIRNLIRAEKLGLSKGKAVGEFLAQFFGVVVLMGCFMMIAFRTLKGAITVGDMVMYFQAFQRGTGYLKTFLRNVASLYENNMFVSYFFKFLDTTNRITQPKTPEPLPDRLQQEIRLEHVEFGYPGGREPVLKDVSMAIKAGEVVALVGANGAGKSTMVKLLCRLYDPLAGSISMDGTAINRVDTKELRSRISVVFQDYVKYYLTVKENIRVGNAGSQPDMDKIEEAARKADAESFIKSLPQGYDTELGRWLLTGEELSIGEWQKIALARAFIRDSQFIILDEPTSSLDVNTEYHLFKKFKELVAGKSALLISHRFSTVRMADRIYVLQDGRITENGTHEELMALDGQYADLYRKQASWVK